MDAAGPVTRQLILVRDGGIAGCAVVGGQLAVCYHYMHIAEVVGQFVELGAQLSGLVVVDAGRGGRGCGLFFQRTCP